MTVLSALQLDC